MHATGEGVLEVFNLETARLCLILDSETHRLARESLRRQQDRDAMAQGIAEIAAGKGISVDEARRLKQQRLLPRKQ